MFHLKYLFYCILIHLIIATPQINLYYTDGVSQTDNVLQYNCLRVAAHFDSSSDNRQILFYCMSELPLKVDIQNNNFFRKFTFAELSKENITSQQLFLWSAPIDLIERYQFYLNQLSTSNDSATDVFYNCTMPRFGPMCQYELFYHHPNHSSLYEIIQDFFNNYNYNPTNLTCYTHLKCNRGSYASCLDWSEICDGNINCLDDGIDEEHCWQLEINQCKDNEYRCRNGQCIPKSFYKDRGDAADCVDASDEPFIYQAPHIFCQPNDGPLFQCEDLPCQDGPFRDSCAEKRIGLLMTTEYTSKYSSVSDICWLAFKCLLNITNSESLSCDNFCEHNACLQIVQNACPEMLYFPAVPILFGNVYFTYKKSELQYGIDFSTSSLYICYDASRFEGLFINVTKVFFNNMTCVLSEPFLSPWDLSIFSLQRLYVRSIDELYRLLNKYHLPFKYISAICNRSEMYQCLHSSKCISIYRIFDGNDDCPYTDDEKIIDINNTHLMKHFEKNYFKCQISKKYIHQSLVQNGACNCEHNDFAWCEDENEDINYLKNNVVFQHICDGFTDLLPIPIVERSETDETECEQWQCNNIYTRCNYVWNCPNGADESGCVSHSVLNCSSKHHLCVLPDTNQFTCLPIEKANDGNIDCLGATDEPTLCGTWFQSKPAVTIYDNDFHCMNRSSGLCVYYERLCDGYKNCEDGDDEQFCTTNHTIARGTTICMQYSSYILTDIEHFLCNYRTPTRDWSLVHFTLDGLTKTVDEQTKYIENTLISSLPTIGMSQQHQPRCHRGLDLRVWLNNDNNSTKNTCLCPPSYYGDQCQYQNQRISLTIKFRALASSWQTLFAIVISLIDDSDQKIIHSYEQITYLSKRDCKIKFDNYLLYSTRPKDPTKNYTIHIDFYEKLSLDYRGSILLLVTFSFLPVHRLSFMVDIPRSDNNKIQSCSNDQCIYGKCIKYSNNAQNLTFCQCNSGWSGKYCSIQYTCTCASDSLCVGISANNRSICVCPMNKFGPRCLLNDTICQTNNNSLCQNNGQCISNVDYMVSNLDFVCICPKGYRGDRCQIVDNQLILSFAQDIVVSQQIFIHFIEVPFVTSPLQSTVRATTFRTILLRQDLIKIYWSRPFHLVFIELLNKNYYLTVVQNTYNRSATINKTIHSSDRCFNISELFNQTFLQWHLLRRIKYYHLPCQNQSLNLSCFYDDIHFCLCYEFQQQRLANCFEFAHNMKFDCLGQSECENGAQCLQDRPDCPEKSMCICPPCFYGRRCQFTTNGFGLSLDAILGYHIIPNISLTQQPFIIKISLALTIIFIVIGLINGILSLITFKNKIVCEVGCGLYLLGSSVTTLLTIIMFGLKFLILLLAQMSIISNRTFLQVQCHSFDFLLRVCLSMDQWLTACVAMERTFTVIKAINFDKKKSKRVAKFIIIILLIVIVGTSIHDPIYRRLIDEENDADDIKRTWCIITYSSGLQAYNSVMNILHFFGPFLINLISGIVLIIKKSHQQLIIRPNQTYHEILRAQLRQHKHLLTAPIVLVILALPRLIITFISKCMKSTDNAWLFLVGYFISFIPPMLTFLVFIVPSKFYKKEFCKTVQRYRLAIQRC